MSGIHRQISADGSAVYTDTPSPTAGAVKTLGPDGRWRRPSQERRQELTHAEVKQLIKDTQKYVPKLQDYFEYIEFLRSHSPSRHRLMLEQLKREDLQAWLKLQKYPQFRPLHETAIGLKAVEKHLGAAIGLATGKFTGSVEKWMETTLKDMMKQQRWGPYADVLGAKATTLPVKTPSYSNSRLGQYLKVEDARAAGAAKESAAAMAAGRAAVRTGVATALSRVGGTGLDVMVSALDPDKATSYGAARLRRKAMFLEREGVLDLDELQTCQNLLSQGKYAEMNKLMDDATARYIAENPK